MTALHKITIQQRRKWEQEVRGQEATSQTLDLKKSFPFSFIDCTVKLLQVGMQLESKILGATEG